MLVSLELYNMMPCSRRFGAEANTSIYGLIGICLVTNHWQSELAFLILFQNIWILEHPSAGI